VSRRLGSVCSHGFQASSGGEGGREGEFPNRPQSPALFVANLALTVEGGEKEEKKLAAEIFRNADFIVVKEQVEINERGEGGGRYVFEPAAVCVSIVGRVGGGREERRDAPRISIRRY